MHNGYFAELDEIRAKNPSADFAFLENIFSDVRVNAFRFLHGY